MISHNVAEKVNGAIEYCNKEAQQSKRRAELYKTENPALAQKVSQEAEDYEQLAQMAKTEGKGLVHEVDIPENPYLLDEDETFFDQPKIVQDALINIFPQLIAIKNKKWQVVNAQACLILY